MKKNQSIAMVAGRSGGHIVPGLTIAHTYRQQHPTADVIFFSTNTPLDSAIVAEGDVTKHVKLSLDNIPANKLLYPVYLLKFMGSFFKSLYYLLRYRPVKVMSMGGYISLPVCLAAKLLFKPVELFELNAVPGKASRVLAKLANTVYICFPGCAQYLPKAHCVVADYPIRFAPISSPAKKRADGRKTLLILGGSQGSLFINNAIKSWIENNPQVAQHIAIIHQTGGGDTTDWQSFYTQAGIPADVFAYRHSIQDYYRIADYAFCRAGAGTLFELAFFKKPSLIIPLETKITDHQLDNARAMAKDYPELFSVLRQDEVIRESNQLWNILNNIISITENR